MKYEPSHEEIQRTIHEQEESMAQLLTNVMERPLAPLHRTIAALQAQITQVQQSGDAATGDTAASLEAIREGQSTQKNKFVEVLTIVKRLEDAMDDVTDLVTKSHDAQAARDGHVQHQLTNLRTAATAAEQATAQLLAPLLAQSGDHADRLAAATEAIDRIDAGLSALCVRIDAVAPALVPRFDALTSTVQEASNDGIRQITAQLTTQLTTQTRDHARRLAATTNALTRIDTGLGDLRAGIDAVAPALAPRFDTLAATVDQASSASALHYHSLSASQQAVVAAAVQEQLAPFQARSRVLLTISALSCASTIALLCLHFIH